MVFYVLARTWLLVWSRGAKECAEPECMNGALSVLDVNLRVYDKEVLLA